MVTQVPSLHGCDFPGGLEVFEPFFLAGLTQGGSRSFGKRCAPAEAPALGCLGGLVGDKAPFEKWVQDFISG